MTPTDTILATYISTGLTILHTGYIAPYERDRMYNYPGWLVIEIDVRAALADTRKRALLLANKHMMTPEALVIVQRVAGEVSDDDD